VKHSPKFRQAQAAFTEHSQAMLTLAAAEPKLRYPSLFGRYAAWSAWLAHSLTAVEMHARWQSVAVDPEYTDGVVEDPRIGNFLDPLVGGEDDDSDDPLSIFNPAGAQHSRALDRMMKTGPSARHS